MTRRAGITLITLLALLFSAAASGASVEARLDRTRTAEGETVVLILTLPGGGSGMPDMSPLAADFDILNHSQSVHMSMINGRSSSSRGLQFVLAPKRTGKLTVPAIRVDGQTTRPLTLQVLPAAQAARLGPAPPVLLEVDADPKQPYVQQKTIYTVRLLSRAPLRSPVVSEPRVKDAIIEPLGRETEYSSQRNGQQYRVVERRYAVFPQRSGKLEIEGPVLSAQLPEPNQPRNAPGSRFPGRDPIAEFDRLFGLNGFPGTRSSFGQTRPIQLRAQNLALDVQAQPPGAALPWLPAESLALNETWSSDPPVFRVGEPITRTIAITAQGLSPTQLPELEMPASAAIKVYPDKSQSQARVEGDTLVAQKLIRAALVPAQAGAVSLPEISLTWWDTQRGQRQVARLPGRAIEVLPGAAATPVASAADPAALPAQRRAPDAAPAAFGAAGSMAAGETPDSGTTTGGYWPWLAVLLGLAWLVTLGLWLHARRTGAGGAGPPPAAGPVVSPPTPGASLTRVEQACRANDATGARQALLAWGQARWPDDPPRRLGTLAQRLGDPAEPVLAELDQRLYANGTHAWDGAAAWERLSPVLARQARKTTARESPLPPLYPQGA